MFGYNLFICGNFNEICSMSEKLGGRIRSQSQMYNFNRVIQQLGLLDLGFVGYPFTWRRGNGNKGGVKERLDRALSSSSWMTCFPELR